MAIQIAKDNGYKSIQIFVDSKMLIKALNSNDCFNNFALNKSPVENSEFTERI